MPGVKEIVEDLGGCAGGRVVFALAKTMLGTANGVGRRRRLSRETRDLMSACFPKLNLTRVRYVENARLFSVVNWFARRSRAITLGYVIYFKNGCDRSDNSDMKLLMHELVHVDQLRQRGDDEGDFACDYGKEYVDANLVYRNNQMEVEARNFVEMHWPPPCDREDEAPNALWLLFERAA